MSLQLVKHYIGNSSLQGDVLIKEFILIPKISPDDLSVDPNVRKSLTSFFKNQFKLFCSESTVFKIFEGGVATKHLEVKVFPLFANAGKFGLTFLHC